MWLSLEKQPPRKTWDYWTVVSCDVCHPNQPLQALAKNVFIWADIAPSALETFCSMGYISLLFYSLTYLLTDLQGTKPALQSIATEGI